MSIPQPDDDDSIPQPDDDDSMFDDNEELVLENRRYEEFFLKTCGCSKVNGKPCSGLFTVQHYTDLQAQASLLTHEQLDLMIMGSIMFTTNVTDDSIHGHHRPAKCRKHVLATCTMVNSHVGKPTIFYMVWGSTESQLLRTAT